MWSLTSFTFFFIFCRVHVHVYILKVCIITDVDFYQTDKLYIFSVKIRPGAYRFPVYFYPCSQISTSSLQIWCDSNCFARNTVNNAPLTMKHVKKKKKTPNTLHENNPLPPAPNVCVPELFNYTDFTKIAILSSIQQSLVYIA
jgi:hypothetical protein